MSVGTWRAALQAAGVGGAGSPDPAGLDLGGGQAGTRVPAPRVHGGEKGALIFSQTAGYYQLRFSGILALVFESEICLQPYLF